jgi:hypothetical protein
MASEVDKVRGIFDMDVSCVYLSRSDQRWQRRWIEQELTF